MSVVEVAADAAGKLNSYLNRIERLLGEIEELNDSLKDLKAEVKADGFNVRAVVKLVKLLQRKEKLEQESSDINDLVIYAHAAGVPLDVSGAAS